MDHDEFVWDYGKEQEQDIHQAWLLQQHVLKLLDVLYSAGDFLTQRSASGAE